MKKWYFYLATILLLSNCLSAGAQQTQNPVYLTQGEVTNTNGYYESLPVDYNSSPDKYYPLLLFIHGLDELGDGSPSQLPNVLKHGPPQLLNEGKFPSTFTVNSQTFSFIVISPQLINWPSGSDLSSLNEFIGYLESKYRIDPKRIYITGLSMGGGITWEYTAYSDAYAQSVAAIVPIAGASYPAQSRINILANNNEPIWAFHNKDDPSVTSSNTIIYVDSINSHIPPPEPLAKKTIFDTTGHGGWDTAYDPNYTEDGLNVYQWMLQYTRPANGQNKVLPIELTYFTAALKGHNVQLNWSTSSELNNDHFEVEKSRDGKSFTDIASLAGAGTSHLQHNYSYIDQAVEADTANLFYRLKQVDKDGHFSFSKVIPVSLKNSDSFYITTAPNPFTTKFEVHIRFQKSGEAKIRLIYSNGLTVYQHSTSVSAGDKIINIDGHALSPGMYILELRENNQILHRKIIKQ